MKATLAIRQFLVSGSSGMKTPVVELKEMKDTCTPEEWNKMGKDAAEALGVEFESSL